MADTNQFEFDSPTPNGFDRCVWCGSVFGFDDVGLDDSAPIFSTDGNYTFGPVRDRQGRQHEYVIDSEPGSCLMHPDCYTEWRTEVAREENQTLDEFVRVR